MTEIDMEKYKRSALGLIEAIAHFRPEGTHSAIDQSYVDMCKKFRDPETKKDESLTLERWKQLTRGSENYDAALSIDIATISDPFVFLVALRDILVFSSGCSDVVIGIISACVNNVIDPRKVEWLK